MKKKSLRIITVFLLIAVCLVLASCEKKNALVGQWIYKSGEKMDDCTTWVFKNDGTGTGDGFPINWFTSRSTIDGKEYDVLTVTHVLGGGKWAYKLTGDRMEILYRVDWEEETDAVYLRNK